MRAACTFAIGALALCAAIAPSAQAQRPSAQTQRLSGAVRSGTESAPVVSALVELRDSTNTVIARQLSSPRGAFLFMLPTPGRYAVDVRRIGYTRATGRDFAIAGDTTIAVILELVALALPAVTARELNRCRTDAARTSATSMLWESAVTSMLSAVATMSDSTFVFDVMPSVRTYTVPDAIFVDIALRDERVSDARPWTSLPAADLAEFGYVRLVGRSLEYVAPDVEVLTSAEFLATHCLRVRDDRLGEGLIGVEFAPGERVTRADIQGVLWIDRASQELRTIDYRYAAMPLANNDSLAGGRVEIVALDGGGWMPARWTVRSPVPERSFVDAVAYRGEDLHRAGLPVGVRDVDPPLRAARLQVTGAAVQRVRRVSGADSAVIWSRPPASVEVTAEWTQNGVTMPASRATVRLSGSMRSGAADLIGRVTFAELPEGDYFVEAQTDIETALLLPPQRTPVRVREGDSETVRIAVLAPAAAVEAACGAEHRGGVLAGAVTRSGRPQADVIVSLWRNPMTELGETELLPLGDTRTDAQGRYVLCRVPRAVSLTIVARGSDKSMTIVDASLPAWRDAIGEYVRFVNLRMPDPFDR